MKRSFLSERNIVVVLFVMVIVIFSFAQADTQKIEKMYLNNDSPAAISLDQAGNTGTGEKAKETQLIIPSAHLR